MTVRGGTEARNPASVHLSDMTSEEIIRLMTDQERRVLVAVDTATDQLAAAADMVAHVYRSGGRVFLLGSGTSGRLAVMEAAELPPTFGIPLDRFVPFVAAGPTAGPAAVTLSEDDIEAAPAALAAASCSAVDAVIGLAASGVTPFVVAGLEAGRRAGAWTCGITNNPRTAVLAVANHPILLDTGPEILTGSTRLKAGTAQKLALNRITTAALVGCGLVRSNLMINIAATNSKLHDRCIQIVADLTETGQAEAEAALEAHGWIVSAAVRALEGPSGLRSQRPWSDDL